MSKSQHDHCNGNLLQIFTADLHCNEQNPVAQEQPDVRYLPSWLYRWLNQNSSERILKKWKWKNVMKWRNIPGPGIVNVIYRVSTAEPWTYLRRPKMKALKRRLWLDSSEYWLTFWHRVCSSLVEGPELKDIICSWVTRYKPILYIYVHRRFKYIFKVKDESFST